MEFEEYKGCILIPKYSGFQQERQIGEYTYYLPDPPNKKDILFSNLPTSKQKWERQAPPRDLLQWDKKSRDEYIDKQWEYRENGLWFMNNGNLEYLTGQNWWYLNVYYADGKYMSWIDAQRDVFYWWDLVDKDPMCIGGVFIGYRRLAKSHIGASILLEKATNPQNTDSGFGMQSKNDESAKQIFNKVKNGWKRLPFYFKPVDSGDSNPRREIRFEEPSTRSSKTQEKNYQAVLNNYIDYRSQEETAYDGDQQKFNIQDEIGKCFAKDTEILMYDGAVKRVQDIVVGDIVMGADSTPRKVLNLTNGEGSLFKVIPKKGDVWACNINHTLTLKVCSDYAVPKKKKGDTLNISVSDYLKLKKNAKRHLMLYRHPVIYAKKELLLDPYILGLWIGDGSKTGSSFACNDTEVIDYLREWSINNNMNFKKVQNSKFSYYISSKKQGKDKNKITAALRFYNIINNKHIPYDYMTADRESRLKLLAGIIDTDGYRPNSNSRTYEVVQKIKKISEQIRTLAISLGYYASINKKTATMKRKDGSVYKCDVYRVNIFGKNIHEIPCRIQRKKFEEKTILHKNTRDSLRAGFKIEQIQNGSYYGFEIEGDNLFMLSDCTVVHNCIKSNAHERLNVAQYCVVDGGNIIGKIYATTTVEEMEKGGGKNCKLIWDEADPAKNLNEYGQSANRMKRLFLPAYYGYRFRNDRAGIYCVDEYGYSNQKEAIDYHLQQRKNKKGATLMSEQRKNPFSVKEAFASQAAGSPFDVIKIQEQMEYNAEHVGTERIPFNKGNFFEDRDGKVRFAADENGRFKIYHLPPEHKRNQFNRKGNAIYPANMFEGVIGVDPVDSLRSQLQGKGSNFAAVGFLRGSMLYDAKENLMTTTRSQFIAFTYCCRLENPDRHYEDMLLASRYYGWPIHHERQKDGITIHFKNRGYLQYLLSRPDATKTSYSPTNSDIKGSPNTSVGFRDTIVGYGVSWVYENVGYNELGQIGHCFDNDLLEDLKNFDPEDWTPSDMTVALLYALAAARTVTEPKRQTASVKIKVPVYNNSGMFSVARKDEGRFE